MAKKRIEKLEGAFPDFLDEEENSLDQILDDITTQKQQEENNQISPENALQRIDDFYEEKISEIPKSTLYVLSVNNGRFRRLPNFNVIKFYRPVKNFLLFFCTYYVACV